ncbi:unnamed protein product [Mesocestoides corti]|uniref:SET domain-containing protein n=1 Tax=Mesocestoides corti TaxID=53468 RepID=A0A0R3UE53_MESCO|nr:unnamed protein product [Mesocestoides corti]
MDVRSGDLQNDSSSMVFSVSNDEPPVPDIGSTVIISGINQSEAVCEFPSKDHNYAKIHEDETATDNQLALLAKLALAKHDTGTFMELPQSDPPNDFDSAANAVTTQCSVDVGTGSAHRGSSVPHVTIIKSPFVNQTLQAASPLQPASSASTCKVATTNGRTILLTPSRGSLGASVQIHRVSSMSSSQVLLRSDFNSGDGNVLNGIPGSTNNTIRCICGFNRDDGCLIQCTNCKVLQHTECMAPSSNCILPKPYLCELCQPRPVMVSEAVGLQRRKMAASSSPQGLPPKTIRLTSPATAFRLPRAHPPTQSQTHNPTIAPNRFFLTGGGNGQAPNGASLSVRPIQVRLGEVVGPPNTGATLYQVESASINQFSPRFINLDAAVARQQSQPTYMTVGNPRSSKRKQDLFTLAGESVSSLDHMATNYVYDENNSVVNDQRISECSTNDHNGAPSTIESNDLPLPKFYRTPSQAVVSASGLDSVECAKPHLTGTLTTAFGETTADVTTASALSCGVPEPASSDVVIWSDSYEKAVETRLSDALKHRIRNIFLTPSERELKTLQMADSSALSRGQQRCCVAAFELGRKGLVATECIYPNQPIIEYKGYAMLMDEYSQQHDYRRHYNPFVLFYKQLDKAVICLDASNYGNEARFIRRCCMPNCEVRLTFPPTDSFSSVVNPQCIQFVVTSAINRVIPVGAELTLAFDFDYTACTYPVQCACGRGAPLCAVADWFRRHHHHMSSNSHHRDYCDAEEPHRRDSDEDQDDYYDFDDYDDEEEEEEDANGVTDCRYGRSLVPRRSHHHSVFVEKPGRSRLALKRLLTPKRVSPAFSRVPYPSAKHMVQEQRHRRHQNGLSAKLSLNKRGGRGGRGIRGSGRGRAGGGFIRQHYRVSRPRGRPPSSGVKLNLVHRPPLPSPSRHQHIDEEEESHLSSSPSSSSPQTDATEPGATSPWLYSARSPTTGPRTNRGDVVKKAPLRKPQQRRRRQAPKLHSPRRTRRRSSVDAENGLAASPLLNGGRTKDIAFLDTREEEQQSPISVAPKTKRVRRLSGRLSNGLSGSRLSEKVASNSGKRGRRQSDLEAGPPSEQGDGEEPQSQLNEHSSLTRSNKSREEKWLAEVMRRIERMEKKRKKPAASRKPKHEKPEDTPLDSEPPHLKSAKSSPSVDHNEVQKPTNPEYEESSQQQQPKEELPMVSKKQRRRSTPSVNHDSHPSATPLSREDRWMQWQLQRIAEMESSDVLSGDQRHQSSNGSFVKQRRRASSGTKSNFGPHSPPPKNEDAPDGAVGAAGEMECSLIVYKHREQDPMAKFSRSRTGHRRQQQSQNPVTRTFSLVESFVEEDLPAGGELLDDHAVNGSTVTTSANDSTSANAVSAVAPSSPPKPSKKRWLSQALMEEDQQQQQSHLNRATPSPESSVTPPDHQNNQQNSHTQRALNPKKRIICQLEEAMAHQHQSPSPPCSNAVEVSPSSEVPTPASKLPPKKRQTEEEVPNNENSVEISKRQKHEKVRMSLSEYRRRRGLSTASVESTGPAKPQPPAATTPALAITPPDSPVVDLKRLVPPLFIEPPTSGLSLGGPRTPSESPSDEDEGHLVGLPSPHLASSFRRSQKPPPFSAPASLPSPRKEAVERLLQKSSSLDTTEHRQTPPSHRPPPGGCDRHLSGHAQRRASPPPPPALGTASDILTSISPHASGPPPIEHVLRRDREILQWQVERQHQHLHQTPTRPQRSSCASSSSTTHLGGNHPHVASNSTPPQLSTSSRSHYPLLPQPMNSSTPTSAFNHHNMESIQETLRRKQEHLRAQLRDLQKATASGSG